MFDDFFEFFFKKLFNYLKKKYESIYQIFVIKIYLALEKDLEDVLSFFGRKKA